MANEILIARVYDSLYGRGQHLFSIVATDSGFQYVFGSKEMFDPDKRTEMLKDSAGDSLPSDADGWLRLGATNLNSFHVVLAQPSDVSLPDTVEYEEKFIKAYENPPRPVSKKEQAIADAHSDWAAAEEDPESEDAVKRQIAAVIDAAGTRDLNPWLDDWLAGKDVDPESFGGLILERN